MRSVITITQEGENFTVVGEGDFDFAENSDSLIAKATIAAINVINAHVDDSGRFQQTVVTGDPTALAMSELKNARRQITWYDALQK